MKSLTKADPNASHEAWNPPDLNAVSAVNSQNTQKEKVLAIFEKEDEHKKQEGNPALYQRGTNNSITSWEPGLLNCQSESARLDEWSFIEVTDTPFDKSWKKQAPSIFSERISQLNFISDNEIPMILERTRLQAEEIILSAQTEADHILLQAQSEIDEQKKEGYQQGRNVGQSEIENTLNAVRKMVEEVEAWKTEFISESEQVLVEMLKDISRKMFGDGAKLDTQTLHTNLNRIMENARGLGVLKIFLNPNDAKLLDPSWSEQQMLVIGEQVKIVASSNILPGGCLIKGNIGTVDGRVETQLDTILKTFDEPQSSDK